MKLSDTLHNVANLSNHIAGKTRTATLGAALAATALLTPATAGAQGWPSNFKGVMLQGFYWDSYEDTQWTTLEKQADELAQYFKLIWVPQSAYCGDKSMGYDDLYWFSNYNSSFGNEAQLRSMIKTFKGKGLGTIADVVINHRKTLTNWVDFPTEKYNNKTYSMYSTDICANDDGGKTKTWAEANGYKLSNNNDTGEDWGGMRDLDHNSANVQTVVKAYLDFLLNDLGYAGFRYDMVKGYAGKFTGMYNSVANPAYSVGEYWDGYAPTVENWLNSTKVNNKIMSAAFDFPFRYSCRDAVNNNNWSKLDAGGMATDDNYKRYAVTFVENHDVEYRSASEPQDPIRRDTLAVNAYMLAMPGTPCVFLKHWINCKRDLKNMIMLRNLTGISNTSSYTKLSGNMNCYAVKTTGDNGSLIAAVGKTANRYLAPEGYALAAEGYHWRYFVETSKETAWPSLPSGEYYDNYLYVKLQAISANSSAQVVYTLDGSEPTATNGTKVANGTRITIPTGEVTLKAGVLAGGKVSGVQTRQYSHKAFAAHDIDVYVNVDKAGWTSVNRWSWGGDGSHAPAKGWPGDAMTTTVSVAGKTWYKTTTKINSADDYVSFVFNTANGSPQTQDVTKITETSYLEVQATLDSAGHNEVTNVTKDITSGIANATVADNAAAQATRVVALDGRTVRSFGKAVSDGEATQGLPAGLYIVNGKKVAVN